MGTTTVIVVPTQTHQPAQRGDTRTVMLSGNRHTSNHILRAHGHTSSNFESQSYNNVELTGMTSLPPPLLLAVLRQTG